MEEANCCRSNLGNLAFLVDDVITRILCYLDVLKLLRLEQVRSPSIMFSNELTNLSLSRHANT